MCKKLLFLISFVAVIGLAGSAFAAELHVYGYIATAKYKTIESAYSAANTGDTITIHGDPANFGLYKYTTTGMGNNDSKHDITFRRYGTDNIRITGQMVIAYHTGWTLDGLSWANKVGVTGIYFVSRAGFTQGWFNIKNCIFYKLGTQSIYSFNSWNLNSTIENCTFLDGTIAGTNSIQLRNYCYNWTIKDSIFQSLKRWDQGVTDWTGEAIDLRSSGGTYCDYCTFYNNKVGADGSDKGLVEGDNALYGTDAKYSYPYIGVNFASLDPNCPTFLYLTPWDNDESTLTGDSNGSYRGARPTPEPATIALLGLGGLALLRKRR